MISIGNDFPNSAVVSTEQGVHRDLPLYFFLQRYRASYLAEMTAFVDVVLGDRPTPVTGRDGRVATVLALAAHASFAARRPVQVAEVDPAATP